MLNRVTITGIDDKTDKQAIVDLSVAYPFVEWGILMSFDRTGQPRYPTIDWVIEFNRMLHDAPGTHMVSAHLCGATARAAFKHATLPLIDGKPIDSLFTRVQLNGFSYASRMPDSVGMINLLPSRGYAAAFILQVSNPDAGHVAAMIEKSEGNRVMPEAFEPDEPAPPFDQMRRFHILFDRSGGKGITPSGLDWTEAPQGAFCGYAGGIGPDNFEEMVQRAAGLACGQPYWVDMESRVRDKDVLQIDRVAQVLELAKQFVEIRA